MAVQGLIHDVFWADRFLVEEAESKFYELHHEAGHSSTAATATATTAITATKATATTSAPAAEQSELQREIARARQQIQQSMSGEPKVANLMQKKVEQLEADYKNMKELNKQLQEAVRNLEDRVKVLESRSPAGATTTAAKPTQDQGATTAAKQVQEKKPAADDDDDFELFGSDDEPDEEAERIKAERLRQYQEKKTKKPGPIAKSNVILDVKPWDDETDMAAMEKAVRSIHQDGLVWGASKFVPVGYGIKKLQISCVVEDDKVSIDDLEEKITGFEDLVQSVDIAAFNKV